ncbi:MAG: V-type ATP synthase subunit E [Methanobacteriota archaeon]
MGLDTLEAEIRGKAKSEVNRIKAGTEAEADQIIKEAEKQRDKLIREAKVEGKLKSERLMRMEESSSQIKSARMIMEAKEEVVDNAIDLLWDEILKYRNGKDYEKLMEKLPDGAKGKVGDKPLLYVRKQDKKLFAEKRVEEADITGGAILESEDGKVRVDYSLDAVFKDRREEIRRNLYKEIFNN